jgi:hypothetical protein
MKCVGTKEWMMKAMGITEEEHERLAELAKNFSAVRDSLQYTLKTLNIENLP